MSTEKHEVTSVKALEHIVSEGSVNKAMIKANGGKRVNKAAKSFDLPPIERFKKVLKKAGVTEKSVALSIAELMKATKETPQRDGSIHSAPDNSIRLKARELWLKYYVPADNKGDTNHLHLHGEKKIDELLSKARRD